VPARSVYHAPVSPTQANSLEPVSRGLDKAIARRYDGSMKVKTSITLSEDLLRVLGEQAGDGRSRSEFIETALWAYIAHVRRAELSARDLEIINRRADYLNQEAADVLDYQAIS